jgi:hypothetical protein
MSFVSHFEENFQANFNYFKSLSCLNFDPETTHRFTELLNQIWGLAGCPLKGQLMLMNR